MAAQTSALTKHATLSTTVADTVSLTQKVRQVKVQNRHATVTLSVTLATGNTAAKALAALTTAVADADGVINIPAGQERSVFLSARPTFVAVGVVGNANPYDVHGYVVPVDVAQDN